MSKETKKISPERRAKKEANKLRYRQLNAQLSNATKASKAGEDDKVVEALRKAFALASAPTVWDAEQARVKKHAKKHKVAVKALS
tara:strand:+ start:2344 stop:2598 length:255 start_codon:yes stop_codon:yes gene_type:complete